MRRLFILTALVVAMAIPSPAAAHEPTRRCSVSVDPGRGGPRDVYRITGRNMPLEENGGSLEVQIDISRVVFDDEGQRLELQTIFVAFLVPNIHRFYVDYNEQDEESTSRLRPGHYVVAMETPHQKGCRSVTGFDVVRGG